jgi:polyphenol oxidase
VTHFGVVAYCDYTVWIVPTRKTSLRTSRKRQLAHSAARPAKISAPWRLRKSGGLEVLELLPFTKFAWLAHGFSTRLGGTSVLDGQKVLNLSFMEWDTRENVLENRRLLQAALGAKESKLVVMRQIHSDVVHPFKREILRFAQNDGVKSSPPACKGDAAITKEPGLLLGTSTADCVPILLVDPRQRAVGAIHAGWRGTLARIMQKTVGRMQLEFGSKPGNLLAAIGPCIGGCCYEVSADFVTKFAAQFADADEYFDEARTGEEPNPLQWMNMCPPGHQPPAKNVHLDLRKANQSQLMAAGLQEANIFVSDLCTGCRTDLFFSYRKEGAVSGRMLSVIGVRRE